MNRSKLQNQNTANERGRSSPDGDQGTDQQRKIERAAAKPQDNETKARRAFSFPSENTTTRSLHVSSRAARRVAGKRPNSTTGKASSPMSFNHGGYILHEKEWADSSIIIDRGESCPANGSAIEQAILRAKDLTIIRLEEEVDVLKRQAARAQQIASSKLREQDEKIRELKRQVGHTKLRSSAFTAEVAFLAICCKGRAVIEAAGTSFDG